MTKRPIRGAVDADAAEELARLASVLCQTDTRLDELTGHEIDSVLGEHGHVFFLRHARPPTCAKNEAAKQAAIINALPAHIALLDAQGLIVSVNKGWRRFAGASMLHNPGRGVDLDYLRICDEASVADADAPAGHDTWPQGVAVVTTIIALAKSLRLKPVAEGVETEEQVRLPTEHGCDEMQGFLFSRDLPVDLFSRRNSCVTKRQPELGNLPRHSRADSDVLHLYRHAAIDDKVLSGDETRLRR